MANKAIPENFYGGENGENLVARSVVVIGSVPTIPQSYNLVMNSYLESDTATIEIPTELINIKDILNKARSENSYVEVEIWSGYLSSQTEQHTFTQSIDGGLSNDEIKKKLLREYKEKLSLRWFGLLDKPTIKYSQKSGDSITLECKELFTFLQDYAFEKKYEGDKSSVNSIISDLKGQLKGSIKIEIDKDVPQNKLQALMGLRTSFIKDEEDKKEELKEYNTVGKTYWDIITEICRKSKLQFMQSETDLKTYEFKDDKTSATLWQLDRVQDYTDCTLMEGKVGSTNSNKLAVVVKSKQTGKEGTTEFIQATFPKELNDDSPESTKVKIIQVGNDKTKEECARIAYDKANLFAKQSLTGTIVVPNGITKIKPNHLLNLLDTSPVPELRKVSLYSGENEKIINFKITSITENFSFNSLTQSAIEFELEPNLNILDDKTGEFKGYKLIPNTAKDNSDLNSIDMRMIDLNKMPLRLLLIRQNLNKGQ